MSSLITAEHLYRYYGKQCAVENVNFTLAKGEVLGFLGPNGAGKTTTMQMLCGNLAPSAGRIMINGYDLLDKPTQAKMQLGYLPETPPLYRELTVDEFLHYCGQLHRLKRRHIKKAVEVAKERCGLTDVSKRLINNLSKGYQQRIGIAQAILHNPEVIVLDEPTVGLDPIQIREIRKLIRGLGENHGVILSTHILPEVIESCTHVQIIHHGKLIFNDSIEGIKRQMKTSTLQIKTRLPADFNALKALPGVEFVDGLPENITRIQHDNSDRLTEHIAETVVRLGWGLLEMTEMKESIEEVFVRLTESDGL